MVLVFSCAVEIPDRPGNFTVDGITEASGGVTITASWTNSSNFERFEIARYDISVSVSGVQVMMATASGTSTSITLSLNENPSNMEQTITITMTIAAVSNCWETGSVATASRNFTLRKYLINSYACRLLLRTH